MDLSTYDISHLIDFNFVAQHGGFARASKATNRPKATLSRHVTALENSLSLRLFERGTKSLKLTENGQILFEKTGSLLAEIDLAVDAVTSGANHPRGLLRISAPILFSHIALGKLAAEFSVAHPEVRIEIVSSDQQVDPVTDSFDMMIRVNPAKALGLIGKCLVRDKLVVVAAPNVEGPCPDATSFAARAVTWSNRDPFRIWSVERDGRACDIIPESAIRLSSLIVARDAVLSGAGCALLPLSLVGHDIAAGRLINWGQAAGHDIEIWVLYTSSRFQLAKVSAFSKFLYRAFPNGTPDELGKFTAF